VPVYHNSKEQSDSRIRAGRPVRSTTSEPRANLEIALVQAVRPASWNGSKFRSHHDTPRKSRYSLCGRAAKSVARPDLSGSRWTRVALRLPVVASAWRGDERAGQKLRIQTLSSASNPRARSSRRSIRRVSFIESTLMVVRPVAVTPSINGPRRRKWSSQRSRRGSNSGTIPPVIGSIPVRFGPLRRLQR
jgi:hypothetical protein